jgi:hypothetical protein
MIVRNTTAALAFASVFALALAASPALAQPHASIHHAAQAQSIQAQSIGAGGMTRHRAQTLRACNDLANRYSQPTFGDMQSDMYRSCMAEHGESE